jgi:hypothetical protein
MGAIEVGADDEAQEGARRSWQSIYARVHGMSPGWHMARKLKSEIRSTKSETIANGGISHDRNETCLEPLNQEAIDLSVLKECIKMGGGRIENSPTALNGE